MKKTNIAVRVLMPVAAALTALFLLTAATAACKSVPPKTWRGTIQLAKISGFANFTEQYFQNASCSWGGNESLNGFDAFIVDVGQYAGLSATATWSTPTPVRPSSVTGYFIDASCHRIVSGGWTSPIPDTPMKFAIPTDAKWLAVDAASLTPSADVSVSITSSGRACKKKH